MTLLNIADLPPSPKGGWSRGEKANSRRTAFVLKPLAKMLGARGLLGGVCVSAVLGASAGLAAQGVADLPLAERARGAERVVVGRVVSVDPKWQVNTFGDRLIVSTLRVNVDEMLKGPASAVVDVEIEGGTIGGLTLNVSDQVPFAPGERAVFFVRRTPRGTFAPHLRGQSLMKLDASNRVQGTNLTLNDIRRELAAANVR